MGNLQTLVEDFKKTQQEFAAKAKTLLNEAVKELMTVKPEIVAIRWNQYTPYFNDGDACEFRVGDVHFKVASPPKEKTGDLDALRTLLANAKSERIKADLTNMIEKQEAELAREDDRDFQTVWDIDYQYRNASGNKHTKDVKHPLTVDGSLEVFAKLISSDEMESILKSAFGDHVEITIDRTGEVTVEEYQHD